MKTSLTGVVIALALMMAGGAAPRVAAAGPPPASMDDIYAAMHMENLRTESGATTFVAGSQVRFNYDLVSYSHKPLVIPFNTSYGSGFYVVGIEQTWVMRLGSDHTLPLATARNGDWYATGGEILVPTPLARHDRVLYGTDFPRITELETPGFPAGAYRYFIEYKPIGLPLDSNVGDVIQTIQIDFTLS